MSLHIGTRLRKSTKAAKDAGYLSEIEEVWEHVCKPPMSQRTALSPVPVLHDGSTADVGTQWRCSECGSTHEVFVPDPRYPGKRDWRTVNGSD